MPRSAAEREKSADRGVAPEPTAPLVVAAGIVWMHGRVVVQRRPSTAPHGAGRLELPGGKLEPGETAAAALARELVEEWGEAALELRVGERVTTVRHAYPAPGPRVELVVFEVDATRWPIDGWCERLRPAPGASALAFSPDRLPVAEFLDADAPIVQALRCGEFRPRPRV